MIRTALATLALGTALVAAAPASAALVTSFEGGLATPSAGYNIVNNFNSATVGLNSANAGVTGSNYRILSDDMTAVGKRPSNSNPQTGNFLSVLTNGAATYTFGANVGGLQFDWGSVDTFNSLVLNYTLNGAASTATYSNGSAGFPSPVNGVTSGRFTVFGNAGEVFTSATFRNTSPTTNGYEIDNIATTAAVPEPATWAMMVLGFGVVGFGMRRRKSVKTTVQFA